MIVALSTVGAGALSIIAPSLVAVVGIVAVVLVKAP